jgi:anti-anti-sigma regulatory factor
MVTVALDLMITRTIALDLSAVEQMDPAQLQALVDRLTMFVWPYLSNLSLL